MSNEVVGLLFGAGFGAWVYSKMMKSTGSNVQTSLIVAVFAGLFGFLIAWTLIGFLPEAN